MEGLDKHLTEEPNTRKNTAEDYVFSKIKRSMSDDGVISWIYPEEALEAIRLSKIEALEEAVEELEKEKYSYNEYHEDYNNAIKDSITILNSQINTLTNGK